MDKREEPRAPWIGNPDMVPWPALAPYARTIPRSSKGDVLFLYDTGPQGEGPALILIHGLGDEADSWRGLFPLLAAKRRVAALDLPGFGRSIAGGRAALSRHADAVSALLAELGPSVLVGNSMGAAIAELAAFRAPESVAGLVLLDGGLPSREGASPAMLGMLLPGVGERGYRSLRGDPEAAYQSLQPYYAHLDALPGAEREFLRARVVARVASESQMRAYFQSMRSYAAAAALHGGAFRKGLSAYPGPVLLGRGELDHIVSPESTRALLDARPDARLAAFPGAGHLPHQEAAEAVAEAVEAFLSRVGDIPKRP